MMTSLGVGRTARARSGHPARTGLRIRISSGVGAASTPLSAFDAALWDAGVANFNLVRLSSVIPPGSRISIVDGPQQIKGGHGDLLYCVYAVDVATQPGETAWAGIAWATADDDSGAGLFVEHTAGSAAQLEKQLSESLADLARHRGGGYTRAGSIVTSATFEGQPAAAVVIATYRHEGWQ
jgi:arginine decarboxylase